MHSTGLPGKYTGLPGKYTGLPGKPQRPRTSGYRASEEVYRASGEEARRLQRPPARTSKSLRAGLPSVRPDARQFQPLTSPSVFFVRLFGDISVR